MTKWQMIQKKVVEGDFTSCWSPITPLNSAGYGFVSYCSRPIGAHVLAYTFYHGVNPNTFGFVVGHICNNRWCWNPTHTKPMTQQENVLMSGNQHTNKTHCHRGHEYTKETSYKDKWGRKCRVCRAENSRKYYSEVKL